MKLSHGSFSGTEVDKIPTPELHRVMGQMTNAGHPFSLQEVEAVRKEVEKRSASAEAASSASLPPRPVELDLAGDDEPAPEPQPPHRKGKK